MKVAPHRDTLFLLAIGLAVAVWCFVTQRGAGYYLDRDVLTCQISGYAALGYLAASLCSSQLWTLLGRFGLSIEREFSARFSRNAGIASAAAALLHTVIAITTFLKFDLWGALQISYLQWGGVALLVLLALLLASFKPLMGLVRWKLWKPLFRLSFFAAALVLPHILFAPFAWRWLILVLYGIGVGISLLRWLPPTRARETPALAEPHKR